MRQRSKKMLGANHRSMAVWNSVAVLESIHRETNVSQRRIAETSGMQPSTVSNIIRELKECGIVREGGALAAVGAGAKQVALEINASVAWVASWKIDLKGSLLCLLDAAGHIVVQEKLAVDLGWRDIVETIQERIGVLARSRSLPMSRFAGLGVCVQGIVDRARGEVIYSHPLNMREVPLREILEGKLQAPVYVERNVPCGAYLEQHVRARVRGNSFLYYLIQRHETFLVHGAGIVLAGEVFRGSHSAAGELTEDFFKDHPSFDQLRTEKDWDHLYAAESKSIALLADFLDVDLVIVSSDDPALTERRFRLLQKGVLNHIRPIKGREVEVMRSQSGPDGMLVGAGLIALHEYFRNVVEDLPNRSLRKTGRSRMKARAAS